MPIPERPISPVPTDESSMNDERRLPPITTQLADYFPKTRLKSPPHTPDGVRNSGTKRKFSFDRHEGEAPEVQGRWKRSMTESSAVWGRPATAAGLGYHHGVPAQVEHAPPPPPPPLQHRNSIAVPPRPSDVRPPPPPPPPPLTQVTVPASKIHYPHHEANSRTSPLPRQGSGPAVISTNNTEWTRDPAIFKLPSPSKAKPGKEGMAVSRLTSNAAQYEHTPQPIHIGEGKSVPISPLQRGSLGQPFQHAPSSALAEPKQQPFEPLSASSRETLYTADSWRRASTSSKSTSNNNSAGAESRNHEFPLPSNSATHVHQPPHWKSDPGQSYHRPRPDESPRSPRDKRGCPGISDTSLLSATTDRSHSDSRFGPVNTLSPSAMPDTIRRNSHAIPESPHSSLYPSHQQHQQQHHHHHQQQHRHHQSPQSPQPPQQHQHQHQHPQAYRFPAPHGPSLDFAAPSSHHHHHNHRHSSDFSQHGYPVGPNDISPTARRSGSLVHSGPGASESRSQYTWEVPGMTGDHVHRKRRGNLPKESTAILNAWFSQHTAYPYPKEEEKQRLQTQTGLSMSQISNWFINARRRRRPSIAAANEENWYTSPKQRKGTRG